MWSIKRIAGLAVVSIVGLIALSACSGSSDLSKSSDASPAAATTAPAASSCTSQAILAALPGGADMESFDCAGTGDEEWAAARVNPGNTVFFLQWDGKGWQAETSEDVCGTASAGVPTQLLSYCSEPTPATTPTPAPTNAPAASCTSQAILAALPGGADMESFDCAGTGDEEWAAARVNPGNTVFFLQWDGKGWQAETSEDVCGTASAGVPTQLLSYCTH